jgi:hypothetical protein
MQLLVDVLSVQVEQFLLLFEVSGPADLRSDPPSEECDGQPDERGVDVGPVDGLVQRPEVHPEPVPPEDEAEEGEVDAEHDQHDHCLADVGHISSVDRG